ncbi:MAG TPA: hypothetical protein VN426_07860 [Syntrophomonadaceae bacterium]|nr:hypothetical protein [Syntrophomonadaceae bacterium]
MMSESSLFVFLAENSWLKRKIVDSMGIRDDPLVSWIMCDPRKPVPKLSILEGFQPV